MNKSKLRAYARLIARKGAKAYKDFTKEVEERTRK